MPQKAPTYYHWSMDKPSTTNQVYGYSTRNDPKVPTTRTKQDPFSYTRPFSNCGFFPQLTYKHRLTEAVLPRPLRPSKEYNPPSSLNKFNINEGYTYGYTPVGDKIKPRNIPSGLKLTRSVTAPPSHKVEKPRGEEIFLWHTLSGTLVHSMNYKPIPPVGKSIQV